MRKLVVVGACLLLTLLAPGLSAADSPTVEQRIPLFWTVFDVCTGEQLAGTGFYHQKTTLTVNANGTVNTSSEFNFESVQLVGLVSGAKYVEATEMSQTWNKMFSQAPQEAKDKFDIIVNRLGEDGPLILGDDNHVFFLMDYTVNANGTVVVNRTDFDYGCQ